MRSAAPMHVRLRTGAGVLFRYDERMQGLPAAAGRAGPDRFGIAALLRMLRRKHCAQIDQCIGIGVLGLLAVSLAAAFAAVLAVIALLCFDFKFDCAEFLDFHDILSFQIIIV